MSPRWRLDRPDWRGADRALLSGVAIYGLAWFGGWLCTSLRDPEALGEGTLLLEVALFGTLLYLIWAVVKRSGMSMAEGLALRPLRSNRETAAFIMATLALVLGVGLVAVMFPTSNATPPEKTLDLTRAISLALCTILANLFVFGYLFTSIEVHAGSLYALAVTGVFAGAISYQSGFAVVVQATLFSLFVGWARARSGTVILPILMNLVPIVLVVLLLWLAPS